MPQNFRYLSGRLAFYVGVLASLSAMLNATSSIRLPRRPTAFIMRVRSRVVELCGQELKTRSQRRVQREVRCPLSCLAVTQKIGLYADEASHSLVRKEMTCENTDTHHTGRRSRRMCAPSRAVYLISSEPSHFSIHTGLCVCI